MNAEAWLAEPVGAVDAVSARAATALRTGLDITTVRDLLEHYPHRYEDVGAVVPVRDATVGEAATVVGTITRWTVARPRGRRMTIAKAIVRDDHGGEVEAAFFNQEWRPKQTPQGSRVAVSGKLKRFRSTLQIASPKLVVLDADDPGPAEAGVDLDADRIQPVYPATEALPSPRIARFVRAALDALPPLSDYLPGALRERHHLLDLDEAVRRIHQPRALADTRPARDRLVYDELLCLQVGLQQRRHRLESEVVGLPQEPRPGGLAERFLAALPFTPTRAQDRAFAEIAADLAAGKPMHRLLQGDVGSGKTIVAAWAMLDAVDHGRQAVLMVPTAVLAEQHLRTLTDLLAPLAVNSPGGPRLELLTGATTQRRLRGLLAEVAVGDVALLVGTHALLEDRVAFADLGVVVVDEQHRFGVEHRTRLRDKRADGRAPDVLVMTATPIPRSLALTLYGDLDVTVLDELPPGRQEIATQLIPSDSPRRAKLYDFVRQRVAAGERAYVVCPLVDESEALRVETPDGADDRSVAAAEEVYARLSTEVFGDLGVVLVHGRLPPAERDAAMDAFRTGAAQILVATTVIEVGVDVPEATVMVIEDADRFGISQLHQLRGRVGRGTARSYCVLFSATTEGRGADGSGARGRGADGSGARSNDRLEALASTTDGFELAELDLRLRGEGSLFDTRQSGLPDLKLAKLVRDHDWVAKTRDDARELVEADPSLAAHPALRAEVARRYGEDRLAALNTG